jgi:hypothetical protein
VINCLIYQESDEQFLKSLKTLNIDCFKTFDQTWVRQSWDFREPLIDQKPLNEELN